MRNIHIKPPCHDEKENDFITIGFLLPNSFSTPRQKARLLTHRQSLCGVATWPTPPCHSEKLHFFWKFHILPIWQQFFQKCLKMIQDLSESISICEISNLCLFSFTVVYIFSSEGGQLALVHFESYDWRKYLRTVTCKPSLFIAASIAAGAQMSHFLIRVTCTYASWVPWK